MPSETSVPDVQTHILASKKDKDTVERSRSTATTARLTRAEGPSPGENGEGGIRTPERSQPPLRDFQSRPFNRSGTSPLACGAQAVPTGYDTGAFAVGRLPLMLLLATSPAVSKDIGLLITFLGIGVLVNLILVFVFVLVRGENQQNQDRR